MDLLICSLIRDHHPFDKCSCHGQLTTIHHQGISMINWSWSRSPLIFLFQIISYFSFSFLLLLIHPLHCSTTITPKLYWSNVIMIITSLIIISSPHRSSWSSPRRSLSLCHIGWCKSCHYHSKSPLLSRHLLSSLLMPNIISVTIIILITIVDNINMKQVISLPF